MLLTFLPYPAETPVSVITVFLRYAAFITLIRGNRLTGEVQILPMSRLVQSMNQSDLKGIISSVRLAVCVADSFL